MNLAKSNGRVGPAPILPVQGEEERPFLSVLIPTYNCAHLLGQTLRSVLVQDLGPDQMQIEVVDDVSTKDDPESVVRQLGGGRVGYFRQPANLGATRNFNACLDRARGKWVHILHGDDYILPGFYEAIQEAAHQYPNAAIITVRVFYVDVEGEIDGMSHRTREMEHFSRHAMPYTINNPFQFAGVVLARSFVEREGGFDLRFAHVTDWEMWIRAINRQGGVAVNRPLACYRMFPGNDTSRLMRTAENLREYLRLKTHFAETVPGFSVAMFDARVRQEAYFQAEMFRNSGDTTAEQANRQLFLQLTPEPVRGTPTAPAITRESIPTALSRVEQLFRAGQLEEMAAQCRSILNVDPGVADAERFLGLGAFTQKRFAEAVEHARRAIQRAPENAAGHDNLSLYLSYLGKPVEAEAAARQALALMPSLANAWHNLGLALNAQDRFAEAETALRRGLDLAPDKADMWNNLATTLQHLGRVPEAILALERALQLWPTFDLARHNLRRLRDRQAAVASAAPKEKSPGAKVCPEILA